MLFLNVCKCCEECCKNVSDNNGLDLFFTFFAILFIFIFIGFLISEFTIFKD